jgi:5-methylcytosine-specific restriction endonuclease McrA
VQKHTRKYLSYCGYTSDFIPCEVCGSKAVDIHHIEPKGMGGSKLKDYYANLIGLCRSCHIKAHANEITKDQLKLIHRNNLKS